MTLPSNPLPEFEGLKVRWIRSARKTMVINLESSSSLLVRSPADTKRRDVLAFLRRNRDWIRAKKTESTQWIELTRFVMNRHQKEQFRTRLHDLVRALLAKRPLSGCRFPDKIVLRSQKTRWGSCSSSGTVSINTACDRLPEPLLEYIVAHELCHMVHLDHSDEFWRLLTSVLPDAKRRDAQMTRFHIVDDMPST